MSLIVSSDLAARANWTVLNNTMGSDHSPTLVKIDDLGDPHINDYRPHSFNMTRADWSQFKRACEDLKMGKIASMMTLITCMRIWFRISFLLLKNASLEPDQNVAKNDYRIGIKTVEMLYMHEIELEIK